MVDLPQLTLARLDPRASAASLTAPLADAVLPITGTTTITSITVGGRGQLLVLEFASAACPVTNGSNLKLRANYVSAADGTLTLMCDGVNWHELGRSPLNLGITELPTVPEASVTHSAAQTIANGAWAILAFNSERLDNDVIHDVTTNNSRLICKTAGRYLIWGTNAFANNVNNMRAMMLTKNSGGTPGAGTILAEDSKASASGVSAFHTTLSVSRIVPLAVNDYVELHVFQDSGGNLNTLQVAEYTPEFGMRWLGA